MNQAFLDLREKYKALIIEDWATLLANEAMPQEAVAAPARPQIQIVPDEFAVVTAACEALGKLGVEFGCAGEVPRVFSRGGQLVELIETERGEPRIRVLPQARLRELLSEAAVYAVWKNSAAAPGGGNSVVVHPPEWLTPAVAARGVWSEIKPLRGIVTVPTLRADGSVLQAPGYDERSGLFYAPSAVFATIRHNVTQEEAIAASKVLLDLVVDFPFDRPEHKSAWLASLLSLFARPAIKGQVPMFAFDATTRSSGKGLLIDVTSNICRGQDVGKTPMPTKEDELRKIITSCCIEGKTMVAWDNVKHAVDSASLEACLTSSIWSDRILGGSNMYEGPNTLLFYIAGNNLNFSSDLIRRMIHIRLASPLENPEARTDFKYPKLLDHVRTHRPELVAAVLTVLRGYYTALRGFGEGWDEDPRVAEGASGSFEAWYELIANCICWLGLPDPLDTQAKISATGDGEKQTILSLLEALYALDPKGEGLSSAEIVRRAYGDPRDYQSQRNAPLQDAIEAICPMPPGKPVTALSLGQKLGRSLQRVISNKTLNQKPGATVKWFVTDLTPR